MSLQETNLYEKIYKIINKYIHDTKKPKQYGTKQLLYISEVHTIEVIGFHKEITATELSQLQGITKGAVSQTLSKLSAKGLILKTLSPKGNNEVLITLTDEGETIYNNHQLYHKDLSEKLQNLISTLPAQNRTVLFEMLDIIDHSLDR